MPQGYLASEDTYTWNNDEIIKDIPYKVKIIDNNILYDSSIKRAFYHIFDFLLHWAKNRIILNRHKFQFCQDIVQCGSSQIMPSRMSDSSESKLVCVCSLCLSFYLSLPLSLSQYFISHCLAKVVNSFFRYFFSLLNDYKKVSLQINFIINETRWCFGVFITSSSFHHGGGYEIQLTPKV